MLFIFKQVYSFTIQRYGIPINYTNTRAQLTQTRKKTYPMLSVWMKNRLKVLLPILQHLLMTSTLSRQQNVLLSWKPVKTKHSMTRVHGHIMVRRIMADACTINSLSRKSYTARTSSETKKRSKRTTLNKTQYHRILKSCGIVR